jgi:hypothetical protein
MHDRWADPLVSIGATIEFFVAYCRSLIASASEHILSDEARGVAGIAGNRVGADQFAPVMRLVKLCPVLNADSKNLAAVGLYFRAVTIVANAGQDLGWNLRGWAERERSACAFFAAVALDQRIAGSRNLLAEQMSNAL